MWKVQGAALLALLALGPSAEAQTVHRQNGFNLPGVAQPSGYDEVRTADGSVCRSAIGNAGAYLDMGAIGTPAADTMEDAALYGRVVVPLGRRAARIDCGRLYELEIERMQVEIRLLRAGLGAGGLTPDARQLPGSDGLGTAAADGDGVPGSTPVALPVPASVPIPRTRGRTARAAAPAGASATSRGWSRNAFRSAAR